MTQLYAAGHGAGGCPRRTFGAAQGKRERWNIHIRPAGALGCAAPDPIPREHAGACMVEELRPGVDGSCQGKLFCAGAQGRPEYWLE